MSDPIGIHIRVPPPPLPQSVCLSYCFFLDDILRRTMYFSKLNTLSDHHLGKKKKLSLCFEPFFPPTFFYSSVQEIRYEKIAPQLDSATLNEATEFNFTVHPNTDYFTR